jgi:hypothetical protein
VSTADCAYPVNGSPKTGTVTAPPCLAPVLFIDALEACTNDLILITPIREWRICSTC